jgi:hypothetical protein
MGFVVLFLPAFFHVFKRFKFAYLGYLVFYTQICAVSGMELFLKTHAKHVSVNLSEIRFRLFWISQKDG